MIRLLAGELLRLPVWPKGMEIGRPVDVIVDPERNRAIGFDILCRDESHRFLPSTAAVFDKEQIAVESPLMLLAEDQLDSYRTCTQSLPALVPVLENVTIDADGTLEFVSHDAA